jgi:hypothetical protein
MMPARLRTTPTADETFFAEGRMTTVDRRAVAS